MSFLILRHAFHHFGLVDARSLIRDRNGSSIAIHVMCITRKENTRHGNDSKNAKRNLM